MVEQKYYVRIERSTSETVVRHRGSGEWDADDIRQDHQIHGFSVVGEKESWDFILDTDPKSGSLYLVCGFYDTGDSFHRSYNHLSLVSLQTNLEDAKAVLKAAEEDYRKNKDDFKPIHVKLPVADRTEEVYTSTWKGYFECLNELRIETLSGGMSVKFH